MTEPGEPRSWLSLVSRHPNNARQPANAVHAHVDVPIDFLELVLVQAAKMKSAICHAVKCSPIIASWHMKTKSRARNLPPA